MDKGGNDETSGIPGIQNVKDIKREFTAGNISSENGIIRH